MFGIVGAIFADFMSTEVRSYNIYTVKVDDVKSVSVTSRSSYKNGDRVSINYPADIGETPDIGIDAEVNLQQSTNCLPEITENTNQSN